MRPFTLFLALPVAVAALSSCGSGDGTATSCDEHGLAEASCPFCHPELVAARGECPEHGLPEAICFACNEGLEVAFRAMNDWCAGHDRPESQCWLCNPQLEPVHAAAPLPPAAVALEAFPETERAAIPRSRRPPSVTCTKQEMRVRFASADVAATVGLGFALAEERRLSRTIECLAEIAYDGNRHARLSTQATAVVESITRDLGEGVRAGETLAVLASSAIADAKAAFLAATAELARSERDRAREVDLLARGISTERDALDAQAAAATARIELEKCRGELRRLGFSAAQVEEIERTGDAGPRLALLAPFAGVVVGRAAARGETVEPAEPVVTVADVSRMWARLAVPESEMREIRPGQRVTVEVDALPGDVFGGTISWVSTSVDPETRALEARAVLDNGTGALRANLFGRARVAIRDAQRAVVVPQDAVQWEGCCNVVFVRRDDTLFEPHKVTLGTSTGAVYEVLEGLEAGEVVVTTGAFLLKTELLKGSIGAGCCEVAPGV